MKHMILRMAAVLAYAAAFSLPIAVAAQTPVNPDAPTASSPPVSARHHHHRDPFMRALRKLTLTDAQKTQIKGFYAAARQANQNAAPAQRHTSVKQVHQQIRGILTPAQLQQLDAEMAKMPKKPQGSPAMQTPTP